MHDEVGRGVVDQGNGSVLGNTSGVDVPVEVVVSKPGECTAVGGVDSKPGECISVEVVDSEAGGNVLDVVSELKSPGSPNSRQLRWVISSCSLWETNGTVLSSLEDYPGVTHVISNGLHVISLFSCEI